MKTKQRGLELELTRHDDKYIVRWGGGMSFNEEFTTSESAVNRFIELEKQLGVAGQNKLG